MSEAKVLADIREALGQIPDARMFRNNVGALPDRTGRLVSYGLGTGTHDLIGMTSRVITAEMVGKRVAIFTAIEVKDSDGRPTKEQKSFRAMVRKMGGLSGIARSISDALRILEGQSTGETDEPRDR